MEEFTVGEIRVINVPILDYGKAMRFEIVRQKSLCDMNIPIIPETREWDQKRKITFPSRNK